MIEAGYSELQRVVTCPGCGAGLTLETDIYVLSCNYYSSVLWVIMPEIPAFNSQNYDGLLRVARRMSYAFNKLELEPVIASTEQFQPVEVNIKEAIQQSSLLLYKEQNYFYLDTILESITFEKNMIESV